MPSEKGTPRSPSRLRSHSPLSISRHEEKEELAHLNDRFCNYIDYVRSLEQDRSTLQRRIHSVTETQHSEMSSIRGVFEDEMISLRKALDDLAREKAGLEVEVKKLRNDAEEAKSKLSRRETDMKSFERKLEARDKELADLRLDHDRYKSLLADHEQLKKQLETAKKQLEQETLLRTDLENKLQTLKEELTFIENVHREEKQKLMQRSVLVEEEVETRTQAVYDSRLREELQAMREQSSEELETYRLSMEETFRTKLTELRAISERSSADALSSREELMSLRKRLDLVGADLATKDAENKALNQRVHSLNELLSKERADYEAQLRMQREENAQLRSEIEERFRELNELMAVKIALDQEILAYRKMLEGEEERCCLSPKDQPESPFAGSRKRRRVDEEGSFLGSASEALREASYRLSTSAHGPARIEEVDAAEGRFVRLYNDSEKDVHIGGWMLRYNADDHDEVAYKFHRSITLKPSSSVKVWSTDAGVTHSPPTDLVLKAQKFFGSANKVTVTLSDGDGDEQATAECIREYTFVSKARHTGTRRGTRDDKCSLM